MKKILSLSFLALSLVFGSCQNKDLCYEHAGTPHKGDTEIRIHWDGIAAPPVANGMRINLFSLDEFPAYGIDDVPYTGTTVNLRYNSEVRTLAYTYRGNNIYFRNQLDADLIEAYCGAMTRATYTRSYPDERTVAEPQGVFYAGENARYTVLEDDPERVIDVYPDNKLYTYTFEVRNVKGAQFIRETRGACSGMSDAYFLGSGTLADFPATILFNASVDAATDRIVGSFKTFGRLDTNNHFTIEALFPSHTNGIIQKTWDVTSQIDNGTNFHIIIEDSEIEIPDEGGEDTGNWIIDVGDWEDVTVPLN